MRRVNRIIACILIPPVVVVTFVVCFILTAAVKLNNWRAQ